MMSHLWPGESMIEVVFHLIILWQAKQVAVLHVHEVLRLEVGKEKRSWDSSKRCSTHPTAPFPTKRRPPMASGCNHKWNLHVHKQYTSTLATKKCLVHLTRHSMSHTHQPEAVQGFRSRASDKTHLLSVPSIKYIIACGFYRHHWK